MQLLRSRWVDVIGLVVALVAAGGLMYALLPMLVSPDAQVVPALGPGAEDPAQIFLTIFVVMTSVGAPVTLAIVVGVLLKLISPGLPASSAVAPNLSSKAAVKAAPQAAPQPLSRREEIFWKIVAGVLLLALGAGAAAASVAWFIGQLP